MRQDMSHTQLHTAYNEAVDLEKHCKAEEATAERETKAVRAHMEQCAADLTAALPALYSAQEALHVNKEDIQVIKSTCSPPYPMKLVLEAVCVLLGVKPVKVLPPPGCGTKVNDYWTPAKKMLADPIRFLQHLYSYDKDNISPATMRTIRTRYLEHPQFCPDVVANACFAAVGLCRWVIGIEVYDRVIKVIEPKRAALKGAEANLAVTIEGLWKKRASLKRAQDKLDTLEEQLQANK